jgi:hypothetical protein
MHRGRVCRTPDPSAALETPLGLLPAWVGAGFLEVW